MTDTYPTWVCVNPEKWASVEGQSAPDGTWIPDFVVEKDPKIGVWLGKSSLYPLWHRFESAAAGQRFFDQKVARALKAIEDRRAAESRQSAATPDSPDPRACPPTT